MDSRIVTARAVLYLAAIGSMLFTGCAKRERSTSAGDQLNVLLITLDTTRADRLSCYGYSKKTTPNLDKLAGEGVRFEMAIAQAAVTPVSHASILTGLNPYRHGVRVVHAAGGYRLPDQVPTLASVLKHGGWRTGAFLSSFTVSEHYGFERGFDEFDSGLSATPNGQLSETYDGFWRWNVLSAQRRSDRTTDQAIDWLSNEAGPWFAWVHYWDPHDDFVRPPDEVVARFPPLGNSEHAQLDALYDAELFFVDQQIGRLLSFLRKRGSYGQTVIVVIADHGEGLSDGLARHGWWHHQLLYQEQIHIPLIIKSPIGPSGGVCQALVRSIDVFPTILSLTGVNCTASIDGSDLLPLMSGQEQVARTAYSDQLNLFDLNARMILKRPEDDVMYCMVDHPWKLVYRSLRPNQSELYNLRTDPLEADNLYGAMPSRAAMLVAELKKLDCFVDRPFGNAPPDDRVMKQLRSLGYLGADAADRTGD